MRRDIHRGSRTLATLAVLVCLDISASCGRGAPSPDAPPVPDVGVVRVIRKDLQRTLVVSSELVPFQQIDVYAKESGFVQKLNVDYGSRVREGEVLAVLEIPELQAQLDEDAADIQDATSQIGRAREELGRVQAEQNVTHLQFGRLHDVALTKPGLIAQQEVDDWQAKDLAAAARTAAARAVVESTQSQLTRVRARERRDRALFAYARIRAPFTGVVTKRYANLGTLLQSGISSSTQAMPLVRLSEDDLFRLVIPVPESYVPSIAVGDAVDVRVSALDRTFAGRVARFSVDVEPDTRTMHTEVDVPNPDRVLTPGLYAEATLTLDRRPHVIAVPQEAVNIDGERRTVWVVDASRVAHLRRIAIGVETADDVEVVSGVKEGERVAVGDRGSLRDGEVVQPKEVQLLHFEQ